MGMRTATKNGTVAPLSELERWKIVALIVRVGEVEASRLLGLSRHAVARAAAGLPVHLGTRMLVGHYLAAGAGNSS